MVKAHYGGKRLANAISYWGKIYRRVVPGVFSSACGTLTVIVTIRQAIVVIMFICLLSGKGRTVS